MDTKIDNRVAAKTALKQALEEHDGDTNHKDVLSAIDRLVAFNPTLAPTKTDSLQFGEWILISAPNFPNGQKRADGKYEYTLGNLAFNIFEPTELKLVIDRVVQPVFALDTTEQLSHNILVEFTIVDEIANNLQGSIKNLGQASASDDRTLQVKFTGAELLPRNLENPEEIKVWLDIFALKKQNRKVSLSKKIQLFIARLLLGLDLPSDIDKDTGKLSFTMSRSPQGGVEIIYLDSDLRITRGTKKKTILVCEKK